MTEPTKDFKYKATEKVLNKLPEELVDKVISTNIVVDAKSRAKSLYDFDPTKHKNPYYKPSDDDWEKYQSAFDWHTINN